MDAVNQALLDENAVLKAQLAVALAKASEDMALIAAQELQVTKLQRHIYERKSERSARLLDQLSLELEELEANATEDELAAERAVAKSDDDRQLPAQAAAGARHLSRASAARAGRDRSSGD